jgi:hypothetical protein
MGDYGEKGLKGEPGITPQIKKGFKGEPGDPGLPGTIINSE